jgi:hypothetical protein
MIEEEEFFIDQRSGLSFERLDQRSGVSNERLPKNFLCYQATLLTIITTALLFNTYMFTVLVRTLENVDLNNIVNNSDFNYLSSLAQGAEKCINNETCIKQFVSN